MSISGDDQQLQMGVGEGMPPPLPPNQARDWHASTTPDLRNHFVVKLARAIFANPDPAAVRGQPIQDVLRYARNVEKGIRFTSYKRSYRRRETVG
uniref:KIX domain-containing protein n=1 Tax=Globodera pallida TaxID=36090 RepID=A0A183C0P7_GLOPA